MDRSLARHTCVRKYLSLVLAVVASTSIAGTRIIGGKPAGAGEFTEVVNITMDGSPCTAVLVGPRVIATAAHCGGAGMAFTFSAAGKNYSGKFTPSNIFPLQDHDIGLGLVDAEVTGVKPVSIGGVATVGIGITMAGYGSTMPQDQGEHGKLYYGNATVTGFRKLEMIAQETGASVSLGDDGGPAYVKDSNGTFLLLGVATKGNLADRSHFARTDIPESQTFFNKFSKDNGNVVVCGVTGTCDGGITPPPAPTCRLVATPPKVEAGKAVTIQLFASGKFTKAAIEGTGVTIPNGFLKITKDVAGTYTAHGTIEGPGGTGTCETNWEVEGGTLPPAPLCRLEATPPEVGPDEPTTIQLFATGSVTAAEIDGKPVDKPTGFLKIAKKDPGQYTVAGKVTGPGGVGTCETTFKVKGVQPPAAPSCQLSATPSVVKLGSTVLLELVTAGEATSSTIGGTAVTRPVGRKTIRPDKVGTVTVNGVVIGPGGTGFCTVAYTVQGDDPIPLPDTDNFAVIPAYCGDNVVETSVARVCIGLLKKDESIGTLTANQVVRITYLDGSVEVSLILGRKTLPSNPGELLVSENLFLFTNAVLPSTGTEILDTRKAMLTKQAGRGRVGEVPVAIQGLSARNKAYVVEQLTEVPAPGNVSRLRSQRRLP